MTKTLRERYLNNEILLIGEIVQDQATGEDVKILDRGSNYVTVESSAGIQKKWIQDLVSEETPEVTEKHIEEDFVLVESGQIKLFGFQTQNFTAELSAFLIEQFKEFDDLYSKHQIVKLLDAALTESDIDRKYDLLEKVSNFYTKHDVQELLIVEGIKNSIERLRLSQIVAALAEIEPKSSPYETVKDSIAALRKKYTDPKQWQVLWPFFTMVDASGITGILQQLPFKQSTSNKPPANYTKVTEDILCMMEQNVDELAAMSDLNDIMETYSADEMDESVGSTAMVACTSTSVLSDRAKKLAETLVKRNLFQKLPSEMNQDEKDTFDSTVNRRKLLVAQLAQKLLPKVKALQA